MLEQKLKSLIPKELNEFPKIKRIGDPYHFESWKFDKKSKELIMKYWFSNKAKNGTYKKRVFINEFESLLKFFLENGDFDRSDFVKICPNTSRDGDCGFAVIVGILEQQRIINKMGHGRYSLINREKIKEWLI